MTDELDWEYKPKTHIGDTSFHTIYEKDGENWKWEAFVRWDGCITLKCAWDKWFPNEEDSDQIHICELNRYIKMLIKLKETIKRHATNFDIGYEGIDDE